MHTRDTDQRARRFRPFGTTIFSEMTALAARYDAVNLGQGFPDFDGPKLGKDAARDALASGWNQYAPLAGMPRLRERIAAWSRDYNALDADPETEVTVTPGCTGALAATMLGLVDEGDEVVLFEPFYDSYRACVAMCGAKERVVPIAPDPAGGGFTFDKQELRGAFSARTRLVLVNTPHNPTGMVFTREQLSLIAELCVEHDALALSDEVYERLVYDAHEHVSIATLPNMRARTVVASSMGKTFSLTGWKVGWTIAPEPLTRAIRAAHQYLTFSVPGPLQIGAAELLDRARPSVEELRSHYASMRAILGDALTDLGFTVRAPQGSYFIMAEHGAVSDRLGLQNDIELCLWLVEHARVAAVPPSAFYANPERGAPFVRFSFCKATETIENAIDRLRGAMG